MVEWPQEAQKAQNSDVNFAPFAPFVAILLRSIRLIRTMRGYETPRLRESPPSSFRLQRRVGPGDLDVLFGPLLQAGLLLRLQRAHDLGR